MKKIMSLPLKININGEDSPQSKIEQLSMIPEIEVQMKYYGDILSQPYFPIIHKRLTLGCTPKCRVY